MRNKDVLLLISPTPQERFLGVARFAREHGWYVSIGDRATPPTDWHGDGVLVTLGRKHPELIKAVRRYLANSIPVVDLTCQHPEIELPRVCGDNVMMGQIAARHFDEHRFDRRMWFSSNWGNVQRLRFDGFCEGRKAKVTKLVGIDRTKLAETLRKAEKPIGVFAYSDYDATKVLNACRDAQLSVPDEVAIIGVDNNTLLCENQAVPLTSIKHDHENIGFKSAAYLEKLMTDPKHTKAAIQLVPPLGIAVRKSTDAIAARDPLVRMALIHIRQSLAKPIGPEEIAKALNTPEKKLSAAFRNELKTTVNKEIIRLRLEAAKRLLRTTDMPLRAIAAETGFCHAAHLLNAFHKAFGTTPRTYRLSF